jgi:MHS family proline/betaine transporter-like MFS transporter
MHHPSTVLGQLGLVLCVGLFGGTQPTAMVEAAPAHERCTTVALGYNSCLGVIGGLTPLAASWLVERTGDELAPAFLIMAAAAIMFLVILRLPETYRTPRAGAAAKAA